MKKNLQIVICTLLASAIAAAPSLLRAQDSTNAPAAPTMSDQTTTTTNAPVKKLKNRDRMVFTGKLTAVDTNAMTFTIKDRTFEITSDTKIMKDGQPATLEDGTVGETASGTYKKTDDGKLSAVSLRFGEKKKNSDSSDK